MNTRIVVSGLPENAAGGGHYFDWVGHALRLIARRPRVYMVRDDTGHWFLFAHLGTALRTDTGHSCWIRLASREESDHFQMAIELSRLDAEIGAVNPNAEAEENTAELLRMVDELRGGSTT
jgi:hypothetical protein